MKTAKTIASKLAAITCALTLVTAPATAFAMPIPGPIPAPIPEIAEFVPAPLDGEAMDAVVIALADAGLTTPEIENLSVSTYEGALYAERVVDVEFDAYGDHYSYVVGAWTDCIIEAHVF